MTKKETAQLLFIAKANWPKYYKNVTAQEIEDMVNVWHMCLSDYDYNTAQAGLKVFLTNDRDGFPPSVGQVIDCIHRITDHREDGLTELAAWGMVYRAVCNANYNAEDEFEKLPEQVREAVGNPARLREWAQLPTDEVQTVIQSNFMRSFRATKQRKQELNRMPQEIRTLIEKTQGGQPKLWSRKPATLKERKEPDGVPMPERIKGRMQELFGKEEP